ncbi:hypothetical protein VE03_10008 [Pseudogymnoascus sp. 23342-1-I1]|nr:hypothetical protein VE03_10008 [Pseudogymnoascus sp. 23342-1-I1]
MLSNLKMRLASTQDTTRRRWDAFQTHREQGKMRLRMYNLVQEGRKMHLKERRRAAKLAKEHRKVVGKIQKLISEDTKLRIRMGERATRRTRMADQARMRKQRRAAARARAGARARERERQRGMRRAVRRARAWERRCRRAGVRKKFYKALYPFSAVVLRLWGGERVGAGVGAKAGVRMGMRTVLEGLLAGVDKLRSVSVKMPFSSFMKRKAASETYPNAPAVPECASNQDTTRPGEKVTAFAWLGIRSWRLGRWDLFCVKGVVGGNGTA